MRGGVRNRRRPRDLANFRCISAVRELLTTASVAAFCVPKLPGVRFGRQWSISELLHF
jgi:hypothetical protein